MSIETIKELRELTGLSFNEIKKALDETGGDRAGAFEILKSRGATIAQKKAERLTHEGVIEAYVHSTKKVGVLLQLQCETDFVARNPLFTELAHDLAMHIAAMEPSDAQVMMGQPFIKDPGMTVGELLVAAIAKLGENIKVNRFERFAI